MSTMPALSASTRGNATAPAGARRRSARHRSEALWGYLLVAPTVLGLAIFYLWPIVETFYFSFTKSGDFGGYTWTGLANYRELISGDFLRSVLNTVIYAAVVVGVGVPLATVVAGLLNTKGLSFRSWYRAVYFIPVVTLPAATGLLWGWLYNSDYGVVNYLLSLAGVPGPHWLTDPHLALYATALVGIWMTLGYNVVIILAGMQEVPASLHEAAMIDGAGPIRRFTAVTIPMISPTLFFVSVLSVIRSLQVFDIVYLMIGNTNNANPAFDSVKPIVYFFYQSGFVENDKGFAAAVAVVLFVLIAALTALQFSVQRWWVHR
jgi:multiple sugar transport system permease protein